MRAFVVDARCGDEPVRACAERAVSSDRVVLIADSWGERRATLLGLGTALVFPPASLRRGWKFPMSSAARSLRVCLAGFDELIVAGEALHEAITRTLAGERSLPPRRMLDEYAPTPGIPPIATTPRSVIRAALHAHDDAADETLIALGCDPDDAASACDFVRACQTLALVGHRVTAIVPRRARELSRAKEVVRSTGIDVRLITTQVPVWSLLPGLDAVVIDAAESPLTPVGSPQARGWMTRCCAACGIPAAMARSLAQDPSTPGLAPADSRLPVHIARALDAALRSRVRAAHEAVPA